jgi:hypothetical protein
MKESQVTSTNLSRKKSAKGRHESVSATGWQPLDGHPLEFFLKFDLCMQDAGQSWTQLYQYHLKQCEQSPAVMVDWKTRR